MNYEQFNQNCADVENYSTNLNVQQAAALWCGVPSDKVEQVLRESRPLKETTQYGQSILIHPHLHCLKTRCIAIQEAIENDEIPVGRDGGRASIFSELQPAYSRRTISREEFKKWIKKRFPDYLPQSLFNDIERNTHEAITTDVYLAMKADRDKLKNDMEQLRNMLSSVKNEKESLITENTHLKGIIDNLATPQNVNIQDTNLIIIGAMIESIKEANKKQGRSTSGVQQKLIRYITETYPNTLGLSESQLQKKFSEANKYIKQVITA